VFIAERNRKVCLFNFMLYDNAARLSDEAAAEKAFPCQFRTSKTKELCFYADGRSKKA